MPRYSDAKLEEALRKCQGMVYVAAKALGCSPNTIKARLEKSERLRAIVEAESEYVDDVAEMRLSQAIFNGEPWAIKYRLSTKGKTRGYTEKQEIEHSGPNGGPIVIDGSTRDTAAAELAEWRKQQAERLSGQSALQIPPTSQTST